VGNVIFISKRKQKIIHQKAFLDKKIQIPLTLLLKRHILTLSFIERSIKRRYNMEPKIELLLSTQPSHWNTSDIKMLLNYIHQIHAKNENLQRKYTTLFERSQDGFVMMNIHGKILDANNAYCHMVGYTRKELQNLKSIYDLTPTSWHPWQKEEIWNKRLLKNGESGLYEKEYIHKNGTCFPVQVHAYAVGSPPNEIEYVWASVRDITEKKKKEVEIQRSLNRLHSIITILQYPYTNLQDFLDYALNQAIALTESTIGYIYFYDEKSKQFELNSWSKEVMKDCTVMNPQTTYHLDQTGIWGEAVRQRKPIVVNDFQSPHPLKKGLPGGHISLCRFLTIPIIHQEKIKAVVGVANKKEEYDTTDTLELTLLMDAVWKTVESIQSNEYVKLLRQMLDASPASITIHNDQGQFLYANDKTLSLHGYSTKEEFLHINLHQLDVPESEEKLQERFQMIADNGEAQFEVEHYKKDGSRLPLDIIAKTIVWKNQPAILSIAVDTTERKIIEEKLHNYQLFLEDSVKRRTEELESLNQELESFAYSVAHDLRTPLRGLFGFSQILLEDYQQELDIQGKEYLQKIQHSTIKMGQLIDDILVLSRASRRELNIERVDMSRMAKRIMQGLQENAPSRKTQISIQPSMIDKGDSHLLQIALENILGNAWKFTEKEPTTSITFGTIQNDHCLVPSQEYPGNQLVYFVRDNGVGFDMRYAGKVFLPFERLHENSNFTGTGIGLATVYRIIQRHRGTIWAHSKPGEGTTLFFTIL
jgi:two-component system, sensor histidine kinase and response regulator